MIDLQALRAAMTVASEGSLTGAARALGVPRATLRRRLEELEVSIGSPLFERTVAGTVPTAAGRRLLDRGPALLDAAHEALSHARETSTSGMLRIVAHPGPNPRHTVKFWEQVRAGLRGAALHVEHVLDPMRDLNEDPGISMAVHIGDAPDPERYRVVKVTDGVAGLFASPDYLASRGVPASVANLCEHPIYKWIEPGRDAKRLPLRAGGSIAVAPLLSSMDAQLVEAFASTGLGIAYIPLLGRRGTTLTQVLAEQVHRDFQCFLVARVGDVTPAVSALFASMLGAIKRGGPPSPARD